MPSSVLNTTTAALAACSSEAPVELFDAAAAESFRLMERDTFERFRDDPEAINALVASYFKQASVDGSTVTFQEFKDWAQKEASVLSLFTGLTKSVRRILQERRVDAEPGQGPLAA